MMFYFVWIFEFLREHCNECYLTHYNFAVMQSKFLPFIMNESLKNMEKRK